MERQNQTDANPLLELSEQDYQLWRHQPTTKAFFKYLNEQAEAYKRDLIGRWEGGSLVLSAEHEYRGVIRTLEEVSRLPLSVIRRFYLGEEEDEGETDPSTARNLPGSRVRRE